MKATINGILYEGTFTEICALRDMVNCHGNSAANSSLAPEKSDDPTPNIPFDEELMEEIAEQSRVNGELPEIKLDEADAPAQAKHHRSGWRKAVVIFTTNRHQTVTHFFRTIADAIAFFVAGSAISGSLHGEQSAAGIKRRLLRHGVDVLAVVRFDQNLRPRSSEDVAEVEK